MGELLSVILKGQENSKSTVAVFLDLSKAFDTLSHPVLLQKLMVSGGLQMIGSAATSQKEN